MTWRETAIYLAVSALLLVGIFSISLIVLFD